ncbi:hydrolase of the alpha/beta superfamily [Aspergillus ellipticus CBS 707.79]|uniref:Hydrolase of the alpha/beta superfamily n=1 Tax=Aspergillus ellipticus CBS 707.79 TaxID=1448320 RepID=A0A319D6X0_9EURO|nr:hydrolase of the alpha/beta superfamily [Aspergillus ellipticus CBS 707.79]
MTSIKEQSPAPYAKHLSTHGFTTLTFDAAYQGESTGFPRGLENPAQRIEDIKAAVTYLSALPSVDSARIGVLGICAAGGYACSAAASDGRIRALGTISAACVGRMVRCGGVFEELEESAEAVRGALELAAAWRREYAAAAAAAAPRMFEFGDAGAMARADSFARDAAEYYATERGRHVRSDQRVPSVSWDLMVGYDAFGLMRLVAPRPVLMIAGERAQTLHFSRDAVDRAREPKELVVVPGKNHFDLYDGLEVSGPKVVEFFGKYL